MRYNDKELVSLSKQRAEKAAELGMKGPKKGSGELVGSVWIAGMSLTDQKMSVNCPIWGDVSDLDKRELVTDSPSTVP